MTDRDERFDMQDFISPMPYSVDPMEAPEEYSAQAGGPLPEGEAVATEADVVAALKTVHDPEIPVNIYDLGLIYEIDIAEDGNTGIKMTLTAPACPVAGEMPQEVADAVARVDGVGLVDVQMVWEPSWNPGMMSEEAKLILDMF